MYTEIIEIFVIILFVYFVSLRYFISTKAVVKIILAKNKLSQI